MSAAETRTSRAGAAALCVLALLAFVATAAVLGKLVPGGSRHERTELKFEHFREHQREFNVLFFGSSRVFRGFDPDAFDRVCAENGLATRSFNFGVPGSHAIEIEHLVTRVRALAPQQIDFVFVDPEALNLPAIHDNFHASSVIAWHDLERTRFVTGLLENQSLDKWTMLDLASSHWSSCAYYYANIGRALGLVDACLGVKPSARFVAETLGPAGNGYSTNDETGAKRARKFERKGRAEYLEALAEFETQRPSDAPPNPAALTLFASLERLIRELGAEPVFVTLPALYIQDDLLAAHAEGRVAHLFAYHDAKANAELYAPETREDKTHLNADGARLFSEKLARDFSALARELGQ